MDFSFDTSAFIEPHIRLYPRDLFDPHWSWIEQLISDGQIRSTELVKDELTVVEDDLAEWSKAQNDLFVPIDESVQSALVSILAEFPNITDHRRDRSGADPWVIALAMANNCPVVTYEVMGKESNPRIPNVCKKFGVEHLSWVDVLRRTRFNQR